MVKGKRTTAKNDNDVITASTASMVSHAVNEYFPGYGWDGKGNVMQETLVRIGIQPWMKQ